MIVFLNGELVPAEKAVVSAFDRGFLFGDGLFETMRVLNGNPFRWTAHRDRFERGAAFLKIRSPLSRAQLEAALRDLLARNSFADGLARFTLSRGVGMRGYTTRGADKPTLLISLHQAPACPPGEIPRWRLMVSSYRAMAGDALANHKSNNKLLQVLARAEAEEAGFDDALLLNGNGHVVETTSANIFWIVKGSVFTPPVTAGLLPGVTRGAVMELCRKLKIPVSEAQISAKELAQTDGVFLTLSSVGIAEAAALNGAALLPNPLARELAAAYHALVQSETSSNSF